MATLTDATLLRIYTSERHRLDGRPLYEAIVLKARDHHLAGATVLRGPLGYGRSSHLHSAKILDLSDDLPVVIEIVDQHARIESFLPQLDSVLDKGLVTLEKVRVLTP